MELRGRPTHNRAASKIATGKGQSNVGNVGEHSQRKFRYFCMTTPQVGRAQKAQTPNPEKP